MSLALYFILSDSNKLDLLYIFDIDKKTIKKTFITIDSAIVIGPTINAIIKAIIEKSSATVFIYSIKILLI